MKSIVLFFVTAILLTSCSSPQLSNEDIQSTVGAGIEQTQAVNVTTPQSEEPSEIQANTNTPHPTNTPRPTSTPRPSNTPEPTSTPTELPGQGIAKNYVVSEEDGGVLVEVARIVVAPKSAFDQDLFDDEIYDDKSTIVEFTFRFVNSTNEVIKFGYSSLTASVNGEQVVFSDYSWSGDFGDELDNDILPGSYLIGGMRTGIKRSSWDEVTQIVILVEGAYNSSTYDDVTKDFLFTIDVSGWTYEPLPDELK